MEALEDRVTPSATYSAAVLALNPAAYYRLGEASGPTAVSQVNVGVANGTYTATGVTYGQPGAVTDDPNTSVSLTGSQSGYMVTGNLTTVTLASTPSVTLSVWFKVAAGNGGVLVDDLGQNTPQTGYHEDDIEVETNGTVNVRVWSLPAINIGTAAPGVWHNAVVTYDSATNTYRGMLDGVASASMSGTRSPPGTQYFALGPSDGTNMGNGSYFTGGIDEFSVFAKALTVAQLQNLYQLGIANDVAFTAGTYSVSESAGNALITITRAANPSLANLSLAETVTFNTSNGSAVAGTDYTAVNNFTVSFAAGQATATVSIPIINRPGVQPSRTVNLSLTQVAGSAVVYPVAGGSAVLTITDANTTTSLTSSANPANIGQPITLTATVTAGGPAAPTGTVTFFDNGVSLGTAALSSGSATLSVSNLAGGSHALTAVYSGDSNYAGSTGALTQVVNGPPSVIITGADAGGVGQVNVYNLNGTLKAFLLPFGTAFTGGVRVATGDVNGDGTLDYIAAAGPGGGPQVSVYDGKTNQLLYTFFAIGTTGAGGLPASATAGPGIGGSTSVFGFAGGLYVAAGDVYGNGYDDIIVGAGAGGGPQVLVFDGKSGALVSSFYAFSPTFRGGVHVAAGDVDGDGKAEIIVGAGAGGGPQVTVYDGFGNLRSSFFAFVPGFRGGVWVSAGDLNGDGKAEIITGAGAGGGPQVEVFDGSTLGLLSSFYAMTPSFTGGVRVAVTDAHSKANIVVAAGRGGGPQVETFDGSTLALLGSFFAYSPTFTGGVMV